MSPKLPADNEVRTYIYQAFVSAGAPPSVGQAARALRAPAARIAEAYRRLAEGHVIVLKPGTTDIWMANPLSAVPTPFTVRTAGRSWWGNCVWDALGVVAMLGDSGSVATECPDCAQPLALEVKGRVLQPAEGIVHFAVPAARWWDDIGYT